MRVAKLLVVLLAVVGCTANHSARRSALFEIGRASAAFAANQDLKGPVFVVSTFFFVDGEIDFMSPEMDRDVPDPKDLILGLVRRQSTSAPNILLSGARQMAKDRGLGTVMGPADAEGLICIGQMFLKKDLSGALVVVGQGRKERGTSAVMYLVPSGSTWVVKGLGDFAIY